MRNRVFLLLLVLVIVLSLVLVLIFRREPQSEAVQASLAEGLAFLEAQEQNDPAEVEDVLKEYRRLQLAAERQARIEELMNGETDVWSQFEDYAILGDSRAVGFWYYDFLPESRVISAGGATILNVAEWTPQLVTLNPAYVFLCFGLNDVSIGYWDSPEDYVTSYQKVLTQLQQDLPDARIFVSSILPARDAAFETDSSWQEIPVYSEAVRELCESMDIPFIDNDGISETYAHLWDPVDGIHLMKAFYPYWGANMLMAIYDDAAEE